MLGAFGGCEGGLGLSGGVGVSGVHWALRECRYSGQQGYRWHQGAARGCQGHWGHQGVSEVHLGTSRECRYLGQ